MSLGYCCAHLRQIEEIPHETIASPCPCRHSSRGCCASPSGCPRYTFADAHAAIVGHGPVRSRYTFADADAAERPFRSRYTVADADAAERPFRSRYTVADAHAAIVALAQQFLQFSLSLAAGKGENKSREVK
jgi:hypothetical protein